MTMIDDRHPTDILAGVRLKLRRNELGIRQEELAGLVGLTFQQIQKYEKAQNRMSASKLKQFADILRVPVSYFFDDIFKTVDRRVQQRRIGTDRRPVASIVTSSFNSAIEEAAKAAGREYLQYTTAKEFHEKNSKLPWIDGMFFDNMNDIWSSRRAMERVLALKKGN